MSLDEIINDASQTEQETSNAYDQNIFSFDAETNGLWGQAFSIAAVITDKNGEVVDQFIGRCPIQEDVNSWVAENVLPQMENIELTAQSYTELLQQFADFYLKHKSDCEIIVHMGVPVEARLFQDMHQEGIIGDWDAPYPLIDIATCSEIRDSVDSYNEKNGLTNKIPDLEGGTHNPLYDSYAAAIAYRDVKEKEIEKNKILENIKNNPSKDTDERS